MKAKDFKSGKRVWLTEHGYEIVGTVGDEWSQILKANTTQTGKDSKLSVFDRRLTHTVIARSPSSAETTPVRLWREAISIVTLSLSKCGIAP